MVPNTSISVTTAGGWPLIFLPNGERGRKDAAAVVRNNVAVTYALRIQAMRKLTVTNTRACGANAIPVARDSAGSCQQRTQM